MIRKHGRYTRIRRWAILPLLIPLVAACSSGGRTGTDAEKTAAIDPPPAQVEQAMLHEAEGAPGREAASGEIPSVKGTVPDMAAGESVTVYLQDASGYLAPMTLRLDPGETSASESLQANAEAALSWMTDDPQREEQLPEGFRAAVPAGAKVDSVKLDTQTGTASVDFAAPLPRVPAAQERKMLEAIVWSLTELPGIDKVKLSAEGKPVRSLPASGVPVDEVLTRGIGINLEQAHGVQMTHAMAVTLYFSARTAGGDGYFVPVTRLVDRKADRMRAALDELINGPAEASPLRDVLLPGIRVDTLTPQVDTVNVSLSMEGWTPDQAVPSEMMEALVLTMTEAADVPRVKVAMNGNDSFLDSDRNAYDRPVNRPAAVNMLKR